MQRVVLHTCLFMLFFVGSSVDAFAAASLDVAVQNAKGKPIESAVVFLEPTSASEGASAGTGTVVIEQKDQQFAPFVSIARVGQVASFPNRDTVRHHVYSFSPALSFDLPLYGGTTPESMALNKEGLVTLGCNIHDSMLAYIYVLKTPYFALSSAGGHAKVTAIPAGKYSLKIWHPGIKGGIKTLSDVVVTEDDGQKQTMQIDIKKRWTAPVAGGDDMY